MSKLSKKESGNLEIGIKSFRYQKKSKPILTNIFFETDYDETTVVFGHTGCGKSTLLRVIGGIAPYLIGGYIDGFIRLNFITPGFELKSENIEEAHSFIGYLFQNPENQLVNSFVLDELVFFSENLGIQRDEIGQRLKEILEFLPINHLLDRPVSNLSQGQKQLIALASVLLVRPQLLLLDEPTAMLDMDYTNRFIEIISSIKQSRDTKIILSTHKKRLVDSLADRIIALEDGAIIDFDKKKSVHHLQITSPMKIDNSIKSSDPILEVKNISFSYKENEVLSEVNLSYKPGEFIWIAGPNGSGKSTLCLLIAGLLTPKRGSIYLNGFNINKIENLNPSKIGIVFQNPDHQIFTSSVKQELEISLAISNIPREEINKTIDKVLSDLRFQKIILSDDPRQLSFGQKKILNIFSFAILKPSVLIIDEPDLALDIRYENEVMKVLKELQSGGTLIISVSHNLGLLKDYATKFIFIEEGRIIYDGKPENYNWGN